MQDPDNLVIKRWQSTYTNNGDFYLLNFHPPYCPSSSPLAKKVELNLKKNTLTFL